MNGFFVLHLAETRCKFGLIIYVHSVGICKQFLIILRISCSVSFNKELEVIIVNLLIHFTACLHCRCQILNLLRYFITNEVSLLARMVWFSMPLTCSLLSFETILHVTLYSVIMPLGFSGARQVKRSCEREILKSSTIPGGPGAE
jgi:hypothetical protein